MKEFYRQRKPWLMRVLAVWAIEVLGLVVMDALLDGLAVDSWRVAFVSIAVIGILNAVLWPFLIRLTLPISVLTFGLFTLFLNGVIISLAADLVPGITITGFWTPIWIAIGLTAVNTILSGLLAIDDDASYYRNVVRRTMQRRTKPVKTDVPGVLFLEIDGLSEPTLRRAIREGFMPTLSRWLRSESHRIVGWECDLSSQTGASQAGILHGDNTNMPAFRWYDRSAGRVMVSNHPKDTAEIERQHSNGNGLLANNGASRGNMFSGDAPNVIFTMSTLRDRSRFRSIDFYPYFANPYNVTRGLILFVWDVVRELRAARQQRRREMYPRLDEHRGGVYPLLRATTTSILRELPIYTLIGDIFSGVPAAYVTFVGYDEVAHHSGVERYDALEVLYGLDQQFARLESAAKLAPRPYHFVILSDHGQSQGATFKQRYDVTLEAYVQHLLAERAAVQGSRTVSEGWGNVNAVLTDVIANEQQVTARAVRRAVKHRTVDGEVVLGPEHEPAEEETAADVMVLASGNLALIYFTSTEERRTYEQMNAAYPALIPGLVQHPGVGFIMVQSDEYGPLAIGAGGTYFLADDHIEGKNPLADFGSNAPAHLRRTSSFDNAPDILVNSFYDPAADEVAAFEELIGCHGGLGGNQTKPFLMIPAEWDVPPEDIVGAEAVHLVLKGWLDRLSSPPAEVPGVGTYEDTRDGAEQMTELPAQPA